ncbi:diacylglycerol/lipid kinase family protein [Mongoliimonas terrestris]|uniref:diacylglycerol/lipid kinase family protein n=1 Tax=Mongoliimonas terrestris TaxID=1709001 RepID=UPI00094973F2|nr:diacylglycerol kinase family protein [Mongoliimonas terrestris]
MTSLDEAGVDEAPGRASGGPAGRVVVVINAKAGAARASDRADLVARIRDAVAAVGTLVDIQFVEPKAWTRTLTGFAERPDVDTVIVGGGDGSVSSAGQVFVGTGKAMGVIPLGTFNLFARSLAIPIGLDETLAALAGCVVRPVDVGVLVDETDRRWVFLHHVSLGFHPQFIEVREAMPYGSRIGKMLASLRVWLRTVRSLKQMSLAFSGDFEKPRARYYQAAVTVGSFREGFGDFPHAEDLTQGDLDLVLLPARGRMDFVMAALMAALGRWRSNSRLDVTAVRRVTIASRRPNLRISIDGELRRLPPPFRLSVDPKALIVLMPPKPEAREGEPAATAI